jgi:DNA modification methylase
LMAADKLGLTDVPVMVASGWTPEQKKAYILADNQLALNAGWDTELLGLEMKELMGAGFDIGLIGFGDDFLEGLLNTGTEGLTDPDDVPETPDDPVTVLGDVYVMGKHRLVCGDSTSADAVAKALNGVEPHLMVTDPPYGVEYDADWRNKAKRADGSPIGASALGKVENDGKADWSEAWALFPGDVAYVWHAGNMAHIVAESLMGVGLNIRSQIIWAKNQLVIGRGDYHPQHEPCWYAVRKGRKGHYNGDRKQTTIWNIDKPRKSETGHSTQKPVECMRRPIVNNSSPGQAIYDPFLGSGTTLIACEMEGRACHGLELSPAYCDVIVKRWEDFTGEKATRLTEAEHVPA